MDVFSLKKVLEPQPRLALPSAWWTTGLPLPTGLSAGTTLAPTPCRLRRERGPDRRKARPGESAAALRGMVEGPKRRRSEGSKGARPPSEGFRGAPAPHFLMLSLPCATGGRSLILQLTVELQLNKAIASSKRAESQLWCGFQRFTKGAPNCTVSGNVMHRLRRRARIARYRAKPVSETDIMLHPSCKFTIPFCATPCDYYVLSY